MAERIQPIDLGIRWEPNAPDAVLVTSDDGWARLALRPHSDDVDERAVVFEWLRCRAAVMGPPNDEAISGHRLWEAGLRDVLWAGEVVGSSWIADLEERNRVHPGHSARRFAALRHFVLLLKGDTVEVVATGVQVHRVAASSTLAAACRV